MTTDVPDLISECVHVLKGSWWGEPAGVALWWSSSRDRCIDVACDPDADVEARTVTAATVYALSHNTCFLPQRLVGAVDALFEGSTGIEGGWASLLRTRRALQGMLERGLRDTCEALLGRVGEEQVLGIPTRLLCALVGIRVSWIKGELGQALESCEALLKALVSDTETIPWGLIGEVWLLKGITLQWMREDDRSEEALGTAHAIYSERRCWREACVTLALIAQLKQLNGELVQARETYALADRASLQSGIPERETWPIYPRIVRLFLAVDEGHHAEALKGARAMLQSFVEPNVSGQRQLARVVLIIAAYALGHEAEARVHFNLLEVELTAVEGDRSRLLYVVRQLWGDGRSKPAKGPPHIFVRFTERAVGSLVGALPGAVTITCHPQGDWLETPSGRHDLRRRHPLRRALLSMIAADGQRVAHEGLIEAAWPGEKIAHLASMSRLRVLIYDMRKIGLREVLLTVEGGYCFDRSVRLVLSDDA